MHAKNTVRYFLIAIALIAFCFFTNDFNLIHVQSTAIVTAIGIDRTDDLFSISAQVAIPSAKSGSQKGESGGAKGSFATIEGSGQTIAQAIDQINQKTGWYPKLVFCHILLLGEGLTNGNVFDALDYFLLNEYTDDDCFLCACDGQASEILASETPLGSTPSLSLEKLFSTQAMRVGATMPTTLREFADAYFSAGNSGMMPIVAKKTEAEGDVFDAGQTALFVGGRRIGTLTREETFAVACVKVPLRLAPYTLTNQQVPSTLTIKNNRRSTQLRIQDGTPKLCIRLSLYAGIADSAKSRPAEDLADGGDLPNGLLSVAEQRLHEQILAVFEKCRGLSFDVFDALGLLHKYQQAQFAQWKDSLMERLEVSLSVKFGAIR